MRSVQGWLMAAACVAAMGAATIAQAGVKDGVDAWQAGDYGRAVGEWRKPAEAGDPDAQFNLAQAYKLGRGVPSDLRAAQDLYYKAAVQGHEQAQANLGLILFQNGDRRGALPWIQKAADRGEPRAQYVLGTALFNGDLLPRDWPRAYALMTRAAASGLPQATTSLAQMDEFIPKRDRQRGIDLAAEMGKAQLLRTPQPLQVADATPVAKPSPAPVPAVPTPAPVAKPAKTPPPAPKPAAEPAKPAAEKVAEAAPKPAVAKVEPKPAAAKPDQPAPAALKPEPKKTAPKPAEPKKAAVAAAPAGKWRVQLGAYSSAAAARTAWNGARVGALKNAQPYIVKAGAVHRLQAGPFATRAAAEKACASAKGGGKGCFVVGG